MIWNRVVTVVGFSILMGVAVMGASSAKDFPAVKGKALNGAEFRVPDDLGNKQNLVLVAFQREQQKEVDTWIPKLERIVEANKTFTFYEFPVLPQMNAFTRWWIYQGMRSGIRSDTARATTVTMHLDKTEFKRHLDIQSENMICIYLLDLHGRIVWETTGEWSQEKEDSLMKAAASM